MSVKRFEGWSPGQLHHYIVGLEANHQSDYAALQAKADKLAEAVLAAWSGWEGQNEMGEQWHDEVKDMDALGQALAAYREGE